MFWGWKRRALQARTIVSDQRKTIEALRADRDRLRSDKTLLLADRDEWKALARARADEIRELHKEREAHLQQISALAELGDELKARADKAEAELAELKAAVCDERIGDLLGRLEVAIEAAKGAMYHARTLAGETGFPIHLYRDPFAPDCCGPFAPHEPIEATITPVGTCEAAEAAPQPAEAACDEEPFDYVADEEVTDESTTQDRVNPGGRLFPAELSDPVVAAGMTLQRFSPHHFKILGGKVPVDFWPYSKRGFTVAVDGGKGMRGHTIESAIALAKGAK